MKSPNVFRLTPEKSIHGRPNRSGLISVTITPSTYAPSIPNRIGRILIMPFAKRLTQMMIAIAAIARIQFADALETAVAERIKPIRTMMGPVTTGGNSFMIFFAPNTLNRIARTT